MLARLRHYTFIGSNNEKYHVDTPGACHHMPYELFMTGNIDNANEEIIAKTVMGKTKFRGNAPFLFLFEPIAIDTGQGFNERCFPVVDMSCCADNDLFHSIFNYTIFSGPAQCHIGKCVANGALQIMDGLFY
jgi:hypothetical protein